MSNGVRAFLNRNVSGAERFLEILSEQNIGDQGCSYLVRVVGVPHRSAEWISEATLRTQSRGEQLISQYKKSGRSKEMGPPYYDAAFDVADHIIAEEEGKFLVKWMHLLHEDSTWENAVTLDVINERNRRVSAGLPRSDSDVRVDPTEHVNERIRAYRMNGDVVDKQSLIMLNYLMAGWYRGKSVYVGDAMSDEKVLPVVSFIDYLMRHENENGPFLVISESRAVDEFYDIFRLNDLVVPLIYVGSRLNISIINELDYIGEDKQLKFNVLVTTPEVLSRELSRLAAVNWRAAVVAAQTNAKVMKRIKTFFRITFTGGNEKSREYLWAPFADVFASEQARGLVGTRVCEHFTAVRNVRNEASSVNGNTKMLSVGCPLTDIQRRICTAVFMEQKENIRNGIMLPVANRIRRVCCHPFSLFGVERWVDPSDFIESSAKIRIMKAVFDMMCAEGQMLVSTELPCVRYIVEDVFRSEGLSFARLEDLDGITNKPSLVTHCSTMSDVKICVNDFAAIVVLDDDWNNWRILADETSSDVIDRIYRLDCVGCKERELSNSLKVLDPYEIDMCCRNVAFSAMINGEETDAKIALEKAVLVSEVDDVKIMTFTDAELAGDDFWSTYFETQQGTPIRRAMRHISDDTNVWSSRDIYQFGRNFFKFGWNNMEDVMKASGFTMSEDLYKQLSHYLLSLVLENLTIHDSSVHRLIASAIDTSEDIDDTTISKSVFSEHGFIAWIQDNADDLANQAFVGHFVRMFMSSEARDISECELPCPPAKWWTLAHDIALMKGVVTYGPSNYELFLCDDDQEIRDIFAVHDGRRLSYSTLNARIGSITDCFAETFSPSETSEYEGSEGPVHWDSTELQMITDYLASFGVDTCDSGEFDWESFASHFSFKDKTPQDIRVAVEDVLESSETNTSVDLRGRVATIAKIRVLFADKEEEEVKTILSQASKWRIMPTSWTHDIEFFILSSLRSRGFGELDTILEEAKLAFKEDAIPDTATLDENLSRRLASLLGTHRVHLTTESPNRQGHTGSVYPVMVTPNSFVHNIGTIEWKRPGFHSTRYIYPVGFKSSRFAASLDHTEDRVRWYSEIIDTGSASPVFTVWSESRPTRVFKGMTPTAPWSQALKAMASGRKHSGRVSSISGPEAFLLASNVVTHLIQNLPNADKCTKYVRRSSKTDSPAKKSRECKRPDGLNDEDNHEEDVDEKRTDSGNVCRTRMSLRKTRTQTTD